MRIPVHNHPRIAIDLVSPTQFVKEFAVYQDDEYIGTVVNVRRKLKNGGSMYGWRPEGWGMARNVKLTSKIDAIRRLPRFDGESKGESQ